MSQKKDKKEASPEPEEADEAVEEEVVSSKRVVYAEIDDEVTSVYDKLRPIKAKNVYIVVPQDAALFQSIVNLKILKRKAKKSNKNIYFITNDKNGIYLAQRIGITVYDRVNNEGKPSLFSADDSDDKLKITPLKASVNAVTEEAPTRMSQKKISISEILKKGRGKKKVNISKINANSEEKKKKAKPKFVLVAPNRHALISLIVVSVIVLLVVVYVALPGVTIYVTPSASVLEQSVNITLADYQRNKSELDIHPNHMIASYAIDTTVTKSITHTTTGKRFSERGANSSGEITVYNTTNAVWPLIPQTRFQTEEGIVFRIPDAVTVPAASSSGLGTLEIYVVADTVDAFGSIVGERGNIGPSKFFLPGLREGSRSKLYAENKAEMTGGVTDYVTYVSVEDLEAARSRMNDELVKAAREGLKVEVTKKSALTDNVVEYVLLEGDGAVKMGETNISVDTSLEGQEISEFSVSGEIYVKGVYYARDEMLNILKDELLLKKSPQKELLRINEESTSYRIFEWDEGIGKIKLTVNIKGIEQYEIDMDKENGVRLLEKIRDHIAGLEVEQAKNYIQNLPEINKVEIEAWPIWSPTIPKLTDNIDFEIRDAVLVD